jgi:hypothetical protein
MVDNKTSKLCVHATKTETMETHKDIGTNREKEREREGGGER